MISSLSMPISGLNTGSVATDPIVVRFSSVCDATWPITSPVTSAPACALAAIASRDSEHEPPIDDDPQRRLHRQHHLLLNFAERHHIQPRGLLVLRQQRHQLAHFFLRRPRKNRIAVKVDGDHAAAAPHQAIRSDRRVDAARQQRDDAPADSSRHAARPGFLSEVIERFACERLDVDRELRIVELDASSLSLP